MTLFNTFFKGFNQNHCSVFVVSSETLHMTDEAMTSGGLRGT
jgi:hypothetical protein